MQFERILEQSPQLVTWVADQGLNLVVAVVIIIAGWMAAGWAARAVRRLMARSSRIDQTLTPVVASLLRYLILIATLIAVLDRFGVQTASLLAVLGAAGLAIGLALQGTLSNVAAGFMLLMLRPFRVGDVVEVAGQTGTVREIGLFATILVSYDGVWRQLPNGTVWSSAIINYSREPRRMMDIAITLDHEDDIDAAIALIRDTMAAEPRLLADPAPAVLVANFGPESIQLSVRAWALRDEFFPTRWALLKTLKQHLAGAGFAVPQQRSSIQLKAADNTV